MSSSVSAGSPPPQEPRGVLSQLTSYAIPPVAASLSIVPVFRELIKKSAEQKGQLVPKLSFMDGLKAGRKAIPITGLLVGVQMGLQNYTEKRLSKYLEGPSSTFCSSAIVAAVSSPFVAVFNGYPNGVMPREILRNFTKKQAAVITVQETAFVGGLSVANRLAAIMKKRFGDNWAVDYTAAFASGALGSLAGHPANTALTRWQAGLPIESGLQLMWGALRKAHAIGWFAVFYKFGKEFLS